jgi:hypothetical protein
LADSASRSGFNLSITESFQWNSASHQFLLKDVVHVAELCFVFGAQDQLVFFEYDIRRASFEVEPLTHFFQRLIESIYDLCGVDLRDDIEGILLRHWR